MTVIRNMSFLQGPKDSAIVTVWSLSITSHDGPGLKALLNLSSITSREQIKKLIVDVKAEYEKIICESGRHTVHVECQ
jgi:hypothetical protein